MYVDILLFMPKVEKGESEWYLYMNVYSFHLFLDNEEKINNCKFNLTINSSLSWQRFDVYSLPNDLSLTRSLSV